MTFSQEILKAVVQAVVTGGLALFGAWLGLKWGLRKYKAEKLYDRQLTAMADILSALREMSRVLEIWIPVEHAMTELWEPYQQTLADRYNSACRKFEDVSAYAVLILPHDAANRIFTLEDQLGKIEPDTLAEEYEGRLHQITLALTWLTDYAKSFRDGD